MNLPGRQTLLHSWNNIYDGLKYRGKNLCLSSDTDINRIQRILSKCMRSISKVGYSKSFKHIRIFERKTAHCTSYFTEII